MSFTFKVLGTAAQWLARNPTLTVGEMGIETDTGLFKIGNGTSSWTSLVYQNTATGTTGATGSAGGATGATGSAGGATGATGSAGTGGVSLDNGCFLRTSTLPLGGDGEVTGTPNSPVIIPLNTTINSRNISLNGNGAMVVTTAGKYNITVCPNFYRTEILPQSDPVSALYFLRVNSTNVANTSRTVALPVQQIICPTTTFTLDLAASDAVSIFATGIFTDGNGKASVFGIEANAAGFTHPAVPALFVSIIRIT
jgi:hypothetical protein